MPRPLSHTRYAALAATVALALTTATIAALTVGYTPSRLASNRHLVTTSNPDLLAAYHYKLDRSNIAFTQSTSRDGQTSLTVETRSLRRARRVLNLSGGTVRTMDREQCVGRDTARGARPVTREERSCRIESSIELALESMSGTGILAASATYDVKEDGGFDARETQSVSVLLFLDPAVTKRPNPRTLAQVVQSRVASMTLEQISIFDQNGTPIWTTDTLQQDPTGTCQNPNVTGSLIAAERLMADCVSSQLEKELGDIVGGTENVSVLAKVNLQATSSTIDTTSGSLEAGYEKTRKVTVLLNKRTVKPSQKVAIEQSLKVLMPKLRDTSVQLVEFRSDDSAKLAAEATNRLSGRQNT